MKHAFRSMFRLVSAHAEARLAEVRVGITTLEAADASDFETWMRATVPDEGLRGHVRNMARMAVQFGITDDRQFTDAFRLAMILESDGITANDVARLRAIFNKRR